MTAVAASLFGNVIKVVVFGVIAYTGIICGKKFRDKKDAEKALSQNSTK